MQNTQVIATAKELLQMGKNTEALKLMDELALAGPYDVLVARMRALAHYNLAQYQEAIDVLQEAILHAPEEIKLYVDICACYFIWEDYQNGLVFILKGLQKEPGNQDLLRGHALMLKHLGRADEALDVLSEILAENPQDAESLRVLGNMYVNIDRVKAIQCFEELVRIEPGNYSNHLRLCDMLIRSIEGKEEDDIARAYQIAQELIKINNSEITATVQYVLLKVLDHDNYQRLGNFKKIMDAMAKHDDLLPLIFSMGRVRAMQDRWDLLEAFRNWGARNLEKKGCNSIHRTRRKLSNKIRIGIVSFDMGNNHVGHFIRPLIEHLDKKKFELYSYAIIAQEEDPLQQAIQNKSDVFKAYPISETAPVIAQSIADDSLDLLVEVGVSFSKAKLLTYRVAPVQVSWLECPHSNGLLSDYIVVDPYINPGQELLLEKPFILPQTWVSIDEHRFLPHIVSDEIPQDRNGYITFGTMNSSFKITPDAFRVWAGIMNMVPGSRFLYVRPEAVSPMLQANFCKYMAQYGIEAERISFVVTRTQHLNQYHNIDIALDVFPHTGGTTTCETLWMGVPVVTLVGPSFFERLSYSNISNAGLGDLCAFSIKEYQNIALQLVADKERRRYLKRNLRQQILQHPLGQPELFTKGFSDTIANVLNRG